MCVSSGSHLTGTSAVYRCGFPVDDIPGRTAAVRKLLFGSFGEAGSISLRAAGS